MRNDLDVSTILSLMREQSGRYVLVSSAERDQRTRKVRRGTWYDEFFRSSQTDEIPRYISELVQKRDLYMAPRRFNRLDRLTGSEADTTLAYADLDERDPRQLPPEWQPHLALETSPSRFQAVWLCDAPVTAELNQRLTYAVGADKGGWAANKLLRLIPGTINHKYPAKPRVRLLWDERASRPPLAVSDLERLPPADEIRKADQRELPAASGAGASRRELIGRYASRRDLLRQHLHDMTPWPEGIRSAVTWKWVMTLMERGASDEDVLVLVEPCGFNKHTLEGLRRTLDKARAKLERRS